MLKLRNQYPFMGKARLKAMLDRQGVQLSVSTVGPIIGKAVADKRIQPASFCEGRTKPKRRRSFDGAWARQRQYDLHGLDFRPSYGIVVSFVANTAGIHHPSASPSKMIGTNSVFLFSENVVPTGNSLQLPALISLPSPSTP